jgi:hypothetical protein
MTPCANPSCGVSFEPKRKDQRYCGAKCRQQYNAMRVGDGALRGAVSRVSLLKGGEVSIVLRFAAMDRDNALQVEPGRLVEVLCS